jgi:membrane protein required for colicin V production
MNLLDLGILILLGLVTIRGYYRGLFQEMAFVVGLAGGVVAAAYTYLRLAKILSRWIAQPQYAQAVAFILILLVVYWLTHWVAHLLQRLLYHLYLDFFERLLGALFGLIKGVLLIGFGLLFLSVLLPQDSRLLKESRTAPELTRLSRQSLELLPPDFKKWLQDNLKHWQEQLERKKPEEASAAVVQDLESLKRSLQGLEKQDETKVENGRPGEKAPTPAPSHKPKFLYP